MRRLLASGMTVVLAAVLAACAALAPLGSASPRGGSGGTSQIPQSGGVPTAWELNGQDGITFLAWTVDGGSVSGAMDATGTDKSGNVTTSSSPVTGKIADGNVSLTVGGTQALGGGLSLTGTINPTELTLSGVQNGSPQTWTFTPASESQYQADVAAFTATAKQAQQQAAQQQTDDAHAQAVTKVQGAVAAVNTAISAQSSARATESSALSAYLGVEKPAATGSCVTSTSRSAVSSKGYSLSNALEALLQANNALDSANTDLTDAMNAAPLAPDTNQTTGYMADARNAEAAGTDALSKGQSYWSDDMNAMTAGGGAVGSLPDC